MHLYPWLQKTYQHLTQPSQRGHAFLLLGTEGLGQTELIHALLRHYLHTHHLQDHPDILSIARLEGKRDISVDQIRAVTQWVQHTAHGHYGRWVVIYELERMNTAATNSLLKTLEEPPSGVRFLLTAQGATKLLPTILSRCQQWTLPQPSLAEATHWLQSELSVSETACHFALTLTHHAPLAARSWLQSAGMQTWQTWQDFWQHTLKTRQITQAFIRWTGEDPERFLTLLSAQCYVELQGEKMQFLPLIRLCWQAQQLLKQNASKDLLIDQILQALVQALAHQLPDIRLNHRRGLLA